MNCLDYRRALLTGDAETVAMHDHRVDCVACTDLLQEHNAFESELRQALEVPLPADFAGRLIETVQGRQAATPAEFAGRRRFLAAAAVGAGAIGIGLYQWLGRDDPLAMACIDFVMKDEAKSLMMGAMPRAEAARVLADTLPLARIERIGQIKHIAPCPFGQGTAYHVILMVPQDKVTLLVMPDTPIPSRSRAAQHGMYASVVPVGRGSVGIVGPSAAVVNSVAGAVRA